MKIETVKDKEKNELAEILAEEKFNHRRDNRYDKKETWLRMSRSTLVRQVWNLYQ
jgi:hypothetical protein